MDKKVVGKEYIGVSAGAVIRNIKGEYFLAKRNGNARDDHGKWEFPGGSIRFYETRANAVKRIMLEKYGIEIEVKGVLGVYDVIDEHNKDHWLSTTFICSILGGEPRNLVSDKCEAIEWLTLDKVRDMELSRISQLNLKDIFNRS